MARTSRRRRELARARYERRQAQAARRAEQRRLRNTRLAAVVSLVVIVGLVVAVTLTSPGVEGETTAAVGATESTDSAAPDAGSPGGASTPSDEATPSTSPDASPDAEAAPSLDPQAAAAAAAVGLDCAPLPSRVTRTPVPIPSPKMQIERTASYRAQITTNCGSIEIELLADAAPMAVNSFVFLARTGYYDNTLCHRLTTAEDDGLSVLQCGDPTGTGSGGPGYQFSVENAPSDGQYPAGTLAMARAASPDSNGSQFFLTYADSTISAPDGYTVFGRVREGLDLLRKIGAAGVDPDNPPRPQVPIAITSVKVTAEDEQ